MLHRSSSQSSSLLQGAERPESRPCLSDTAATCLWPAPCALRTVAAFPSNWQTGAAVLMAPSTASLGSLPDAALSRVLQRLDVKERCG